MTYLWRAVPNTLSIIASKFSFPATWQLQPCFVWLPLAAALKAVIFNHPLMGTQSIGGQRGIWHCSCVFERLCQFPGQHILVILYHIGSQTYKMYTTRMLHISWDEKSVNVWFWTDSSELEIHLLRMLTDTGEVVSLVCAAEPIRPAAPVRHHLATVLASATSKLSWHHSKTSVHILPSVVVLPVILFCNVTEKVACCKFNLKSFYL